MNYKKYKNKIKNKNQYKEDKYKKEDNKIIRQCKVEENIFPIRIDKYLGDRFSYYSRTKWQNIISNGLVELNGIKPKYTRLVRKGDTILYHLVDLKEPEVSKDINIIYDDGDLVVVNKPANLPVIPSGRYYHNTLHSIISEQLNISVRMLNRIDRETSGCVVLCRTHNTASKFSALIKNNKIKKIYLAIIESDTPPEQYFTVEGFMVESGDKNYRRYQTLHKESEQGKYSKTSFKTLKTLGKYSLLLCKLHTGRMHQIRVHLKSKNYYLLGDKIYGRDGAVLFDNFLSGKYVNTILDRQALHSYKLCFIHPITGEKIKVKADIPMDLKKIIRKKL